MYAIVYEDRIEIAGIRLIKEYKILSVCDDYDSAFRILRGVVEYKNGYWSDSTLFYSNDGKQRWTIKQVG